MTTIRSRRGTTAALTANDPTPARGEIVVEFSDAPKADADVVSVRVGDGVRPWSELIPVDGSGLVDAETAARIAADLTLEGSIDDEASARTGADSGLSDDITALAGSLGSAAFTPSGDYATAAQGSTADTAVQPAALAVVTPIVTRRTSGDLTLTASTSAWAPVDPTGSTAARDLDIVFSGVVAGQQVRLGVNAFLGNQATAVYLDFWSVVAAAKVNAISSGTSSSVNGVGGWVSPASFFGFPAGSVPYTIQAGDIENGSARFRLYYKTGSAASKTLYASTAAWPIILEGSGPFG